MKIIVALSHPVAREKIDLLEEQINEQELLVNEDLANGVKSGEAISVENVGDDFAAVLSIELNAIALNNLSELKREITAWINSFNSDIDFIDIIVEAL